MLKTLLVILMVLYTIIPYDLLPDFVPVVGWLDDLFLLGVLIYYFKEGKLPSFFSRYRTRPAGGYGGGHTRPDSSRTDSDSGGRSQTQQEGRHGERDPFEILGVKPGAKPEEIRAAYRRIAQAYHPDKVSHLGPEFQELAKRKFIEIQDAYEALMRNMH
jgi:hypothetical protein